MSENEKMKKKIRGYLVENNDEKVFYYDIYLFIITNIILFWFIIKIYLKIK